MNLKEIVNEFYEKVSALPSVKLIDLKISDNGNDLSLSNFVESFDSLFEMLSVKQIPNDSDEICSAWKKYFNSEIECVDETYHENDDNEWVFHIKKYDKYICVSGYYTSYQGFEPEKIKIVTPVQKMVTFYE